MCLTSITRTVCISHRLINAKLLHYNVIHGEEKYIFPFRELKLRTGDVMYGISQYIKYPRLDLATS